MLLLYLESSVGRPLTDTGAPSSQGSGTAPAGFTPAASGERTPGQSPPRPSRRGRRSPSSAAPSWARVWLPPPASFPLGG